MKRDTQVYFRIHLLIKGEVFDVDPTGGFVNCWRHPYHISLIIDDDIGVIGNFVIAVGIVEPSKFSHRISLGTFGTNSQHNVRNPDPILWNPHTLNPSKLPGVLKLIILFRQKLVISHSHTQLNWQSFHLKVSQTLVCMI